MKIKWLAHACFLITSDSGIRIINDPYKTGGRFRYGEVKESADIVTVSHEHGDHNNVAAIQGNPTVIKGAGKVEVKGIKFNGIPAYHDKVGGKETGNNTIFCFEVDGVKVCHLGDLGHPLSGDQVAEIGKVDILLAPVGGVFAIDGRIAMEIAGRLAANVVMPMHYKTDRCDLPIAGVDEFLLGKPRVRRLADSEVEFKKGKFSTATEIIVLQPAL